MTTVESLRDRWRRAVRDQIGRARDEVTTPALLLDLDVAKRNIATMAERFRELPAELRPHIKVHKSPQLALLQCQAGAIGVACATVWEALVMAEAGIDDVLVANQVVHPDKMATLAGLPSSTGSRLRSTTLATSTSSTELRGGRVRLELLIEVDVGMGRCGVRTREEALLLAERIAGMRHVRLRGMQGYEGHCMLEPDRDVRLREAHVANAEARRGGRPPRRSTASRRTTSRPAAPARTSSPAPTRASPRCRRARTR